MRSTLLLLIPLTLLASSQDDSQSMPWAKTQPLSKLTGLQVPKDWEAHGKWKASSDFKVQVADLPRYFDWRYYANGLPPVNRQRAGDCWAQGTVGVLESLIKIRTGLEVRMSVQEVISCSHSGTAARGGFFAHEYHKTKGGADEGQFPYQARDVRCKAGLEPKYRLKDWGYVGAKGRKPSVVEMKQAMMEHSPLGTTIYANGALQGFKGDGVFKGCGNGGTNHIEVIVGWNDDEPNSQGVWFVRNSWGPTHGQDGYAKIPYGCSRVGDSVTWADLDIVIP